MPTETVTLTLSEDLSRIVQKEIESGRYRNAEEVVSAALHSFETEDEEDIEALRALIDEGIAGGIAEGGIDEVFGRVFARAGLKMPARS